MEVSVGLMFASGGMKTWFAMFAIGSMIVDAAFSLQRGIFCLVIAQ